MIQTLNDLIALAVMEATAAEQRGFPGIAARTRLEIPGSSEEEINMLRQRLQGIPESYLDVAKQITLAARSIGYLDLSPGPFNEDDLLARLVDANSDEWILWELVDQHRLYHVAGYPGCIVCVARQETPVPGEVVFVDYDWGDEPMLRRTAWSFEQLLLGFGRIREQRLAQRKGQESIDEVLSSLRTDFGFDDEQMEDWAWFVGVALGQE